MLASRFVSSKSLAPRCGQVSRCHRGFATVPLTEPLHGVPPQTGKAQRPDIKLSKLSNGVQIVTVKTNDPIASVGLFVGGGTREENAQNAGSSLFLRHMGFKSTQTRHSLRVIREMEVLSANYSVGVSREYLMYGAELPVENVGDVVPLLADALHPQLDEYEVYDERKTVELEAKTALSDAQTQLFETLHQEAYRNKGLGQGLYAAYSNSHNLKHNVLKDFLKKTYSPERMALVTVGNVNHDDIMKTTKGLESFKGPQVKAEKSNYYGGDVRMVYNTDPLLAIGFEGLSANDRDFMSLGAIQYLLGGGRVGSQGSLEAKGSRFNRNVVEKNPTVKEMAAFNFNYSDSGIFGVQAVARKGSLKEVVSAITQELNAVSAGKFSAEELAAAKAQLKANLLFSYNVRNGLLEQVGRRTLSNRPQLPFEVSQSINDVSVESVKNLAKRVLSSRPTLVVIGDVTGVPTAEEIQKLLK